MILRHTSAGNYFMDSDFSAANTSITRPTLPVSEAAGLLILFGVYFDSQFSRRTSSDCKWSILILVLTLYISYPCDQDNFNHRYRSKYHSFYQVIAISPLFFHFFFFIIFNFFFFFFSGVLFRLRTLSRGRSIDLIIIGSPIYKLEMRQIKTQVGVFRRLFVIAIIMIFWSSYYLIRIFWLFFFFPCIDHHDPVGNSCDLFVDIWDSSSVYAGLLILAVCLGVAAGPFLTSLYSR